MITCSLAIKITDYFPKIDTIPYENYVCLFTFGDYQGQIPFLPDENQKYTDQLKNITSDIKYKIHVLNVIDMSLIGMCEIVISYNILNQVVPPNGFIQEQQKKLLMDLKTKRKLFGSVVKAGDIFLNIYSKIYLDSKINIENIKNKRKILNLHPYVKLDFHSIKNKDNSKKKKNNNNKMLIQSITERHQYNKSNNSKKNLEKINKNNFPADTPFIKNNLNENNNIKRISKSKNKNKSVQKNWSKNRNNYYKNLGNDIFNRSIKSHINCTSSSYHIKNDLITSNSIKNFGNCSMDNNDFKYYSDFFTLENQRYSEKTKEVIFNKYLNGNTKNDNFIFFSNNSVVTSTKSNIKNTKLYQNENIHCAKTKYLTKKLKNLDKNNFDINNINVVKNPFLSAISTKGITDPDKILFNIGANLRNELIEQINGNSFLNQKTVKNNCLKLIEYFSLLNKNLSKLISKNKKLNKKIYLYTELLSNKNKLNHIIINKENNIDYIFLNSNYSLGNKLLSIYPKTKKIEMQIYKNLFNTFYYDSEVQTFKQIQKQQIQNTLYLLINFIQNLIKKYGNISQIFYDDTNKKLFLKNCLKKYDISEKPENEDCVNLVELFFLKKAAIENIENDKFKIIKEIKEEDEDENENDSQHIFQRSKSNITENDKKLYNKENCVCLKNTNNYNKRINEEELIEKKLIIELYDKYQNKYNFKKITPYKYMFNNEEVYASISEEGNIILEYNGNEYSLEEILKLFEEEETVNNNDEERKNDNT